MFSNRNREKSYGMPRMLYNGESKQQDYHFVVIITNGETEQPEEYHANSLPSRCFIGEYRDTFL